MMNITDTMPVFRNICSSPALERM
ncbi:hypothetical protein SEA_PAULODIABOLI_175 [Microbacterium phage PauloDiaboli]|nr:hypothetical protein SEA_PAULODIABOLI_175 [Microbacterium phage PauloDiaboli]